MSNATTMSPPPGVTIRPEEAAHFGKLAAEWWDPKGSSAMLHRLNPVRLRFVRDCVDAHWPPAAASVRPLAGKRALDVGCGAGLLCEPLARLGAAVTGVDAAAENVAAAEVHAEGSGLLASLSFRGGGSPAGAAPIDSPHPNPSPQGEGLSGTVQYVHGDLASLDLGQFDLVTAMEVIEHVADKRAFVAALAASLAPGGLMVLSTPNRTAASRLLMVEGAERFGLIPRGTHHWDDFVTPVELHDLLREAGLTMGNPMGIAFSPMKSLHLSDNLSLNYIVSARRT